MNEINYPTAETQGPFLDYKHSYNSSFRSTNEYSRPTRAHPLKRRTRIAICCWSSLLVFAIGCLCTAVISIILIPDYGIKVGIPVLLIGAACTGVSIFCFYTMYTVPECKPDANVVRDMSHGMTSQGKYSDTKEFSDGVTDPTAIQPDSDENEKTNASPLLKTAVSYGN